MSFPHLNYLAVLISALVIFFLGAVWYSPALFARRWMALMGKTEEEMKAAGSTSPMPLMFLMAFLCGLAISLALAVVMNHFTHLTVMRGAMVGAICWVFAGATSYASAIFSMQPKALWLINSMYNLVSFVLAGMILAAWR